MTASLAQAGYGLTAVTDIAPEVLSTFRCGKPSLDRFLTDRADFMHHEHLSSVWVVFHADVAYPVGYFTLHNDSLELSEPEEVNLGLRDHADLKRFPAVVIGKLAIDERLHGTGASDAVMRLALDLVLRSTLLRLSAARIVAVDAVNEPKVLRFYTRNGFERSQWADKQATNQGGKAPRTTIKMLRDILA